MPSEPDCGRDKPILIATSNKNKFLEFAVLASARGISVGVLPDFSILPPVKEDFDTFEGNARKKAEHYSLFSSSLVVADDSGLQVAALHGAPGVRSARYSADETDLQENSSEQKNNDKLLQQLSSCSERSAAFICVLAAAKKGKFEASFRGEIRGEILAAARGSGGFGYDPLFLIPGLKKTLAELSTQEKCRLSHRGKAFEKLSDWFSLLQE